MLRVTLQVLGLFLLASACASVAIDAARSYAAGRVIVTPIGDAAAALAPGKMDILRRAIDAHAHPLLGQIVPAAAQVPACFGLACLGALAFWLARKPPQKIGYSSR